MADYTEHYQLHQWQPQDPFLRTDFNEDFKAIDMNLATLAKTVGTHAETLATKGNCTVEHQSYTGTGDGTRTLTFLGRPQLVVIMTHNLLFVAVRGEAALARNAGIGGATIDIEWGENSITWYGSSTDTMRVNIPTNIYQVTALSET